MGFTHKIMTVNVTVATVWTTNQSYRELDRPAISHPVRLEEWLLFMNEAERLDLCESNRIQTQLLFGEQVLLLEYKHGWAHIIAIEQSSKKDSRGYPGWVPLCQLENYEPASNDTFALITSRKALLTLEKTQDTLVLSYQTKLSYLGEKDGRILVDTPLGIGNLHRDDIALFNCKERGKPGSDIDIVTSGEQFLGLPYLWGGLSSYGYDCSGFTYTIYKANGYSIPRDASEQAQYGTPIALNGVQRGDLLFFAYDNGKGAIHHVGIYYGQGKLLHSPHTGKSIEIIPIEGTIYEKELCMAMRCLEK
ncbi:MULTISPECIES: C40 family peptidase [Bacillaceae]|uniref:C40 family peptidase n=1 Tax=Bacillaceae TaxID=186817 RepID=UPI00280B5836|nr:MULTISPECIES: C40 family peptidase [Bacillaceae]